MLAELLQYVPGSFGTYFEPFFGGGALFFALKPRKARLSDSNAELINCYQQVRAKWPAVHRHLLTLRNSKSHYYRVRAWQPRGSTARAARTLYLAALSFNGIFRVNKAGVFNVPYGGRTSRALQSAALLAKASLSLKKAQLRCNDFAVALRSARSGDLVYLDPPYTVTHGQNGFLKYNANIFSWADQERLATETQRLVSIGCGVIMTNAAHASIRNLYRGLTIRRIKRVSRMAATSTHRRTVEEFLITNLDRQ